MNSEIDKTIRHEISELTDFDVDNLNEETVLSDIGFDSLDFLSVQIGLKRKNGILLDLSDLAAAKVTNYGEFISYIATLEKKEQS